MSLKPLHDRVLVKRVEETEEKVGNIVIPDTAREKPQQAEVIAVGAGRLQKDGSTQPLAVQEGDRVLFGKYSGTEVQLEGEDYLILREDDILGILS